MPFLTKILSWLPGIGAFFAKKLGESDREKEIEAEIALQEAQAFKKGRIAPRYMRRYLILLMAAIVFAVAIYDLVDDDFSIDWQAPLNAVKNVFLMWGN